MMKRKDVPSFSARAIGIAALTLALIAGIGAETASADRGGLNGRSGGFPALLAKLERIDARLGALERELIPCTAERYRADLCRPEQTPFDLAIDLCGSAGGETKLGGKLAVATKASVQGGGGWKEVLDVDLTVEAAFPAVLLAGVPVVLPSEVAVSAGGAVGLGLNGCLELTKVQIGPFVPRARILSMLGAIEQGQEQLAVALADTLDSASSPRSTTASQGAPPRFDTARLAQALRASQAFASARLETSNPLEVWTGPAVSALRSTLPLGDRLQGFLDEPTQLIPELDPTHRMALCDQFPSTTPIGQKLDPVCGFLDALPPFETVAGAFEEFDQLQMEVTDLKSAVGGLPEVIKTTVEDALPEVTDPTPPPPDNPFCNLFPNSPFCR